MRGLTAVFFLYLFVFPRRALMRRGFAVILILAILLIPLSGLAQIYPPKPGVPMPQSYFDRMAADRTAFQFQRAWIQKVEQIKKNREAYIQERGFYNRQFLTADMHKSMAVTGTLSVPVFCSKYTNTGADPYAASVLDTKLYTGPFAPQTMTEYYTEISYGDLNMTGTVYGWHQLSQNDTYYEGPAGCNGLCGSANTGQFMTETLNAWDGSVDFGQYDNDGPDGIPNSGDDDGYVDFVAFVQPEAGGECGNNNIWSHRWVISGWIGGSGWTSNDPSNSGGFIKANDYVMQPALNCGGVTPIDIGVFCHEFGHALGLPDLYDVGGGSAGVGHWGLMGSGSWNSVTQPAHMCAWAKDELGWVNLVEMGTNLTAYNIDNVEYNRPVYRANIMNERWHRQNGCVIGGSYSMRCGLGAIEAASRSWPGGEGYGNAWSERVSHDFNFDGLAGPVTLQFDYTHDSEANFDFTYLQIDVGGTVTTLATYHGNSSGTANFNLAPYLSVPTDYTINFLFTSDGGWSDEDYNLPRGGNYRSTCGPFVFDDVSLIGGGEAYATDFETREDGWWVDMVDPSECFFVENRQPLGSDVNLHGGGGLCIWHIDDDVANSAMGNSGGSPSPPGLVPRGVELEQADGLTNLQLNNNRGDGGDPFPGNTNNMTFTGATNPNSNSYDGNATNAVVLLTTGNGDPIGVQAMGGWFPPTYASSNPPGGDNNQVVSIAIFGTGFVYGAAVNLIDGPTNLSASDVEWIGHDLVLAEVDINSAPGGLYDIVLTNPGGGSFTATDAFNINDVGTAVEDAPVPGEFALKQNYPNPFNPTTTIPFDVKERTHVSLKIYNLRGQEVRTLVDETLDARSYGIEWNGHNDAGSSVASGVYFYKLVAGNFQDVRKLVLMK
jgi:M6 family metalloprotease-like protein